MGERNLAARAGRWSAEHWKTAVLGWVLFVAAAYLIGTAVGTRKLADADTGSGETARAQHILAKAGFEQPAAESVLVQSASLTPADPAFRRAVGRVVGAVLSLPQVTNVRSPLAPTNAGQLSGDGHSALVQFDMRGKVEDARKKKAIVPVLDAVARVAAQEPQFRIEEFGVASAGYELEQTLGKDFQKAEQLSLPITLVILFLAFGALVAAGVPLLLGFTAVVGALGVAKLISHALPQGDPTSSVILMIGLAVGVDYSLFYLRREREERRAGLAHRRALLVTAGTSGQAVLVSGVTVLIAMAGMLFAGNAIFTSIGAGTMVVVAASVAGSLTVLPALLSKLGDNVERGRIPFLARRRRNESRLWGAVLGAVLRRPLLSFAGSAAALVALAVPAFSMHTKLPSFTDLPNDLRIVRAFKDVQAAFPGAQTPAEVVVKAPDVTAPAVAAAINDLNERALASGQMGQPITVSVSADRTVARVAIPFLGGEERADAALGTLRRSLIPQTLGALPDVTAAVTGQTAGTKDFNDQLKARAPLIFVFVLGLAFLLLLFTFRSLVIPIKAIVLNLLSVGASYGILVLVFQHTWAEGILGFKSNGAITAWLPLFLFVVLFGLSMDYHVFILSRVKELVDQGERTGDAVATAIRTTAGTVTAAAVVMVAVFAIFATLRTIDIKQLGIGLAVAILLDATIVRAVLLPASMKLLGEWNWYLPRWLEWVPNLEIEAPPRHEPEPAPATE